MSWGAAVEELKKSTGVHQKIVLYDSLTRIIPSLNKDDIGKLIESSRECFDRDMFLKNKKLGDICYDTLNEICANKHKSAEDTFYVIEVQYRYLIVCGVFNLERTLEQRSQISKQQKLDLLVSGCPKVEVDGARLIPNQFLPLIFKTDECLLRVMLLDTALKLIEPLPITLLPKADLEELKKIVKIKYIPQIEQFQKSNSPIWSKLWILLIRYLRESWHEDLEVINGMLRVVERAFRSPKDQLVSYDIWKELIDNYSLNINYISYNKHINLLMTPLKATLSRSESVILKRMEVWLYLLKTLKVHAVIPLETFLSFCFGPFELNMPQNVKRCPKLWEDAVEALTELLGHHNHEGGCLRAGNVRKFVLEKAVVNFSNFSKVSVPVFNSIVQSCLLLEKFGDESKQNRVIGCLWGSFFNILKGAPQELKIIHPSLVHCIKTHENHNFLKIFFKELMTSELNPEKFVRFSLFPLIYVLLEIPSLCSFIFDLLDFGMKSSPKTFFGEVAEFFSKNEWRVNVDVSTKIWIKVAGLVNRDYPVDNLVTFMSWPSLEFGSFSDDQQNELLQILKTLTAAFQKTGTHTSYFEIVQNEFQNILKHNPQAASGIAKLIRMSLKMENTVSSSFVESVLKSSEKIIGLPHLTTETVADAFEIVKVLSEGKWGNFDKENQERLVRCLSSCLKLFLARHKHLPVYEHIEMLLKDPAFTSKSLVAKDLHDTVSQLTTDNDKTISSKSIQLLALLMPFIKSSSGRVENSRAAKLASMGKQNYKSPVKDKKTPTRGFLDKTFKSSINTHSDIFKKPKSIYEENSSDFVPIDSEPCFDPKKMSEHQLEVYKKRREDIPALYEDLSQSNSQSQGLEGAIENINGVVYDSQDDCDVIPSTLEEKRDDVGNKSCLAEEQTSGAFDGEIGEEFTETEFPNDNDNGNLDKRKEDPQELERSKHKVEISDSDIKTLEEALQKVLETSGAVEDVIARDVTPTESVADLPKRQLEKHEIKVTNVEDTLLDVLETSQLFRDAPEIVVNLRKKQSQPSDETDEIKDLNTNNIENTDQKVLNTSRSEDATQKDVIPKGKAVNVQRKRSKPAKEKREIKKSKAKNNVENTAQAVLESPPDVKAAPENDAANDSQDVIIAENAVVIREKQRRYRTPKIGRRFKRSGRILSSRALETVKQSHPVDKIPDKIVEKPPAKKKTSINTNPKVVVHFEPANTSIPTVLQKQIEELNQMSSNQKTSPMMQKSKPETSQVKNDEADTNPRVQRELDRLKMNVRDPDQFKVMKRTRKRSLNNDFSYIPLKKKQKNAVADSDVHNTKDESHKRPRDESQKQPRDDRGSETPDVNCLKSKKLKVDGYETCIPMEESVCKKRGRPKKKPKPVESSAAENKETTDSLDALNIDLPPSPVGNALSESSEIIESSQESTTEMLSIISVTFKESYRKSTGAFVEKSAFTESEEIECRKETQSCDPYSTVEVDCLVETNKSSDSIDDVGFKKVEGSPARGCSVILTKINGKELTDSQRETRSLPFNTSFVIPFKFDLSPNENKTSEVEPENLGVTEFEAELFDERSDEDNSSKDDHSSKEDDDLKPELVEATEDAVEYEQETATLTPEGQLPNSPQNPAGDAELTEAAEIAGESKEKTEDKDTESVVLSPEKQLPSSPQTPARNSELLNSTTDISPIKIVPVHEKPLSSDMFSEELTNATKEPTVETDGVFLLKIPKHRSARLLNLVSANVPQIPATSTNGLLAVPKLSDVCSSPKTGRVRRMMKSLEEQKLPLDSPEKETVAMEVEGDKVDVALGNYLTFTRELPSPLATPKGGSILKRKLLDRDTTDDLTSPCPKRKRVNFSDPPTTCEKLYLKEEKTKKKKHKPSPLIVTKRECHFPQEGDAKPEFPIIEHEEVLDIDGNVIKGNDDIAVPTDNEKVSAEENNTEVNNLKSMESWHNRAEKVEEVETSTSKVEASTSNVDIEEGTSKVDAGCFEVETSTSKVETSTSNVEASTSNVEASTSDVEEGISEVDAGTFEVDTSTSDVDKSTSKNPEVEPSTSAPEIVQEETQNCLEKVEEFVLFLEQQSESWDFEFKAKVFERISKVFPLPVMLGCCLERSKTDYKY